MPLESGVRVGEYEIVGAVGAGGMGEVYRARDHRLGRDVAIKILPEAFAGNHDRLLRLQREAQSAGALNHPNLLTIHELGVDRGRPFIVSELLDGSTLRDRMSGGPLSPKRAADYASQIAEGLAAAHERGIVHRDLKPENIFVTRDGRVKILDFGLAKSIESTAPPDGSETAEKSLTDPGAVVGTVGYMSPEQVRGGSVDARSDIFTLGAILYEMLSGRRAFHGTSSVDTMHAILHADPPELSDTNPQIPPALARIVNHCLEKDPERRFQAARDLAFALQSMSGISSEAIVAARRRAWSPAIPLWIAAIAAAAIAIASWFASRAVLHPAAPRFQRLTFRSSGSLYAAFTNDQQSIIYSTPATRNDEIQISPIGNPEMRSLGIRGEVLSVSSRGEAAVLVRERFLGAFIITGTLARLPIAGGAPREIADDVQWADWNPAGDDLAILRTVDGKARIEMPIGKVLYQSTGWITTPRVSPDGKSIAFIEHPTTGNDAGFVALLEGGKKRVLTPDYESAQGLAWKPDGKEVWFTAAEHGNSNVLMAVGVSGGAPRLIVATPGILRLCDIARDGRVLLMEANARQRIVFRGPGDTADHDLSWLDWSRLVDISPDGKTILFDETGEGAGAKAGVYVRGTDGSPAVRLGDGVACAFSPDRRSVLAIWPLTGSSQIWIYPTAVGQPRQITNDPSDRIVAATLTPDGRSLVFRAIESGSSRLYVQSLDGGRKTVISPQGVGGIALQCAPDGKWVYAFGPARMGMLYALQGGAEVKIPEIRSNDAVIRWTADGKGLLFFTRNEYPVRVRRLDLATHGVTTVREITIPESDLGAAGIRMTPDLTAYAYSFYTTAGDLFLLQGVN